MMAIFLPIALQAPSHRFLLLMHSLYELTLPLRYFKKFGRLHMAQRMPAEYAPYLPTALASPPAPAED
jgi:hypothetical protein